MIAVSFYIVDVENKMMTGEIGRDGNGKNPSV
jgi:hypothetical protein